MLAELKFSNSYGQDSSDSGVRKIATDSYTDSSPNFVAFLSKKVRYKAFLWLTNGSTKGKINWLINKTQKVKNIWIRCVFSNSNNQK